MGFREKKLGGGVGGWCVSAIQFFGDFLTLQSP